MDFLLASWTLPIIVVAALGVATLGFAVLIGRWIDAQSNSVLDEPKEKKRETRNAKRDA
jgi:hypothetical protein